MEKTSDSYAPYYRVRRVSLPVSLLVSVPVNGGLAGICCLESEDEWREIDPDIWEAGGSRVLGGRPSNITGCGGGYTMFGEDEP